MAVDQRYAYVTLPDGAEFQVLGEHGTDEVATAEAVRAYLVDHPQPAVDPLPESTNYVDPSY